MRKLIILLSIPLLGACARPPKYIAPAPAGALQCALREAEEMGYQRMEGEPKDGFTRVAQRLEPPPAQRVEQPGNLGLGERKVQPREKDPPLENQLLLRERPGQLQIQVVSIVERNRMVQPTAGANDHAQMILAACAAR